MQIQSFLLPVRLYCLDTFFPYLGCIHCVDTLFPNLGCIKVYVYKCTCACRILSFTYQCTDLDTSWSVLDDLHWLHNSATRNVVCEWVINPQWWVLIRTMCLSICGTCVLTSDKQITLYPFSYSYPALTCAQPSSRCRGRRHRSRTTS